VAEKEVENLITKIKNSYDPYKGLEGEKLHEIIFATVSSSGACGRFYCCNLYSKCLILVVINSVQIRRLSWRL
jgi:hypothetical protein